MNLIAVIDGECALCNRTAQLIDKYDRSGNIRIATSQGQFGSALMRKYGVNPTDPTSWLFVDNGVAHKEMEAVIRISQRLSGPVRILSLMRWCPAPLRNRLYRSVARNRYRLYGKADLCQTPSASLRARIIDSAA
jgi:predicted DCC family thiol-disulfide oxidoreductase YuxK